MTVRQVAEVLGLRPEALRTYIHDHDCTLQEAMDAYREGRVKRGGRKPVEHRVQGRQTTVREAAEKLGVSVNAVRLYMSKHKVGLAATIRHYEKLKTKRAEKAILDIIWGK